MQEAVIIVSEDELLTDPYGAMTMEQLLTKCANNLVCKGALPIAFQIGLMLPAEFEEEALKAQAVVARTFAWKAVTTGGKHGDHSLCINSSCCQGYVSEENYIRYYGTEEEVKKIRNAVQATAGTVVTYGGELIEATYFSSHLFSDLSLSVQYIKNSIALLGMTEKAFFRQCWCIGSILMMDLIGGREGFATRLNKARGPVKWAVCTLALALVVLFGSLTDSAPMYFDF